MATKTLTKKPNSKWYCFYNAETKRWWNGLTEKPVLTFSKASVWKLSCNTESSHQIIRKIFNVPDGFKYHPVDVEFKFKRAK